MNMHQSNTEDKGEILASFVRQVLPDSKNFYQNVTKEIAKIDPLNTSDIKNTELYLLVPAFYITEKLMKPTESPAPRVIREVKKYYDKIVESFGSEQNIPTICLSKEHQKKLE